MWLWRSLRNWLQRPHAPAVLALILATLVWIWAASQHFIALDDPRLARLTLGEGAQAQIFQRDALGGWRVASFDNVPADSRALEELARVSLQGRAGQGQVVLVAFDKAGRVLARGFVSAAQAKALQSRPYAPRLTRLPPVKARTLAAALLMGSDGPAQKLSPQQAQQILSLINDLRPRQIKPGSQVAWRELVMVEMQLTDGGRLYVQATHDGVALWIRIAGNNGPKAPVGQGGMAGSFNDFRNFAYAIAPERWPATLQPSRPKCDPTLSPTPCPKPVP